MSLTFSLPVAHTADDNDELCREAIPSMSLRHLRTSRFTFFDAVNDQISTRYSEFLDPNFGGYAIRDKLSPIVDNPFSMSWHSISYASGNRDFSLCKADASMITLASGIDTLITDQKNVIAGFTAAINASNLNVEDHPIPQSEDTATTKSNAQSIIGGVYGAYMTKNFNFSAVVSVHNNDATFTPEGAATKTQASSLLGISPQVGATFNLVQGSINHQAGLYLAYENVNLDALSVVTQGDTPIHYEDIDLSTIVPGIRWQSNAYYATSEPGEFIGWKGVVNARRVYPLGPTSWSFYNENTGARGNVNLDSEWTEIALDGTVALRSIHAQEVYVNVGYKSVFGEHSSQNIGGGDVIIKLGAQLLF